MGEYVLETRQVRKSFGEGEAAVEALKGVDIGVAAGEMLARLPELCLSTGSACHSDTPAMSPTLAAMGVDAETARGTVRLSLGWYTTDEDVDRAASLLIGAWEALRP